MPPKLNPHKKRAASPSFEDDTESKKNKNVMMQKTTSDALQNVVVAMSNLPRLTEVKAIMGKESAFLVPTVNFRVAFSPDLNVISRLLNLSVVKGTESLINIATANPDVFKLNARNYISYRDTSLGVTSFFMTGVSQHSALTSQERTRQICMIPPRETWARTAAFLGAILHETRLHFPAFQQGLSFSTWAKTEKTEARSNNSPRKGVTLATPAVESSHGPTVRDPTEKVPIYDGRTPFSLGAYSSLHPWDHEIANNAAVLVIFTVATYPYKGNLPRIQKAISFNVQNVIFLAESPDDSGTEDDDLTTSQLLGVEPLSQDVPTSSSVNKGPTM